MMNIQTITIIFLQTFVIKAASLFQMKALQQNHKRILFDAFKEYFFVCFARSKNQKINTKQQPFHFTNIAKNISLTVFLLYVSCLSSMNRKESTESNLFYSDTTPSEKQSNCSTCNSNTYPASLSSQEKTSCYNDCCYKNCPRSCWVFCCYTLSSMLCATQSNTTTEN
jgi:hypothetical protein